MISACIIIYEMFIEKYYTGIDTGIAVLIAAVDMCLLFAIDKVFF